ncbi:MAG TPA: hypothetical protein VE197_18565, partial [Mycobacterium sp.]|nr:hypothetical protein [Mycobacterium sp.]
RGYSVDVMKIYVHTAAAFAAALDMAKGEPGIDPFFDIPYGTGTDGVVKWPSLQYTRYRHETGAIRGLYDKAKAYADKTGQKFSLFVPDCVPYYPSELCSYNPDSLSEIVEISDQKTLPDGKRNPKYDRLFAAKVFTAWFENGEKW